MSTEFNSTGEATLPEFLVQVEDWLKKDQNFLAGLCNVSSFLYHSLQDVSWFGWYVTETIGGDLTLGPFQGLPTVARVPWGQGVVGSAALERAVQIVEDIRRFPGHIKDGLDTRSEVALPIIHSGLVRAVLSVKSASVARFGVFEVELFSALVGRLAANWPTKAQGLDISGMPNPEGGARP